MVITEDIAWLQRARSLAQISPDRSRKTGCIVVNKYGNSITSGVNTFPEGVQITEERLERPAKYLFTEHAERNAIYAAAADGIALRYSTMYLPWYPCTDCARAIVQAGIKRLVSVEPDWTEERYNFNEARQILAEGKVTVEFATLDAEA